MIVECFSLIYISTCPSFPWQKYMVSRLLTHIRTGSFTQPDIFSRHRYPSRREETAADWGKSFATRTLIGSVDSSVLEERSPQTNFCLAIPEINAVFDWSASPALSYHHVSPELRMSLTKITLRKKPLYEFR